MGRQAMASDLFTKSGAQGSLSVYAGRGASQRGAASKHAQAQSHRSKDADSNMGGDSERENNRVSSSLMTPPNTAPLNRRWFCQDSLDDPSLAEEPHARSQALRLPGPSDITKQSEHGENATDRSQTPDDPIIMEDIDQPTHGIETPDGTAQVLQSNLQGNQHPAPRNESGKLDTKPVRQAITLHKRDSCRKELVMAQRAISYPGLTTDRLVRIPGLVQGIQESPELRRQVLHLRSSGFQFLLLPRDLRDKIACHLFATGSLELLRVCSKLHDELEPLVGEHAICRISIGASTHVKPFPLLTAEENSGIDQVQITMLRIFDDCFPEESNMEHLSQFAGHPLTRRCCRVTIVSYPEQCWKPAATLLETLGTYIYFKTFVLDVRIIDPERLSPRLLDPDSLSTASSNIHPGFPNWYTISQPASWNDLRAVAMLLQNRLGPFHLPRNQKGAVFHPLDFHRGLQISQTEQGGFYNPDYESFYVPFFDGVRPQFGLETAMQFTRPITKPVQGRARALAPVPARATTRSSKSQCTQAARPTALSQGVQQAVDDASQIPASQANSYVYAAANPAAAVPNAGHHPTQPVRQGDDWHAAYKGQPPLHTLTHTVSWYAPEPPGQQPFISNNPQPLPQPQPRTSNVRAERPRQVTRQVCIPNTPAQPRNQSRQDSTDPIVRYPYAPTRPRVQTVPSSKPSTTTEQRRRPDIPNIHVAGEAAPPQLNAPPPQSTTQQSTHHSPSPSQPPSAKPKRPYINPTSNGTGRTIAPRPYPQPAPPDTHVSDHANYVNEGFYHATPSSRRNASDHLPAKILASNFPTSPYLRPDSRAHAPGAAATTSGTVTNNSNNSIAQQQQQQQHDVLPPHPGPYKTQNRKKKGRALSTSPPPPPQKRHHHDNDNERTSANTHDETAIPPITIPLRMDPPSDRAFAAEHPRIPRQAAIRHLMDEQHDEGEESERSIEEMEAAVALGWMKEGGAGEIRKEEEEEEKGKGETDEGRGGGGGGGGAGVVDRGRESSGWRVMDLG